MVFSADGKLGPCCGMILSDLALDVETALDLGIGPRSGTNPRSSPTYIFQHTMCFYQYMQVHFITNML